MNRIPAAPFITLLKRAVKSGYGNYLIMKDRMFINSYDPDSDSDHGYHYMLLIPQTEEFADEFYDTTMMINPTVIVSAYEERLSELTELRKNRKLRPKDAIVHMSYKHTDGYLKLIFEYQLVDEVVDTSSVCIKDMQSVDSKVELMVHTFNVLSDRIDYEYPTICIDGLRSGFVDKALASVRVCYVDLKLGGIAIKLPLIRSMLNGNKTFEKFDVLINRTVMKNIYTYTINYIAKGVEEIFLGYIQNF